MSQREASLRIYEPNGRYTGSGAFESIIHRKGNWHYSICVIIYNTNGQILIDVNKDNKWDSLVKCHVIGDDTEVATAIHELREVVGIYAKEKDLYHAYTKAISQEKSGFINNEFQHIFFLRFDASIDALNVRRGQAKTPSLFTSEQILEKVEIESFNYAQYLHYWAEVLSTVKILNSAR